MTYNLPLEAGDTLTLTLPGFTADDGSLVLEAYTLNPKPLTLHPNRVPKT